MAQLDTSPLVEAGVDPDVADAFILPLANAMTMFDIDSPRRIAAFIGQALVESAHFSQLRENMFYGTPERIHAIFPHEFPTVASAMGYERNPERLANRVYANRLGNGDEASGDGYKYRAGGIMGITGRHSYSLLQDDTGVHCIDDPDILGMPDVAALSGAWFWHANGLNPSADEWNIDYITDVVNGPVMLQAGLRKSYSALVLKSLAPGDPALKG